MLFVLLEYIVTLQVSIMCIKYHIFNKKKELTHFLFLYLFYYLHKVVFYITLSCLFLNCEAGLYLYSITYISS